MARTARSERLRPVRAVVDVVLTTARRFLADQGVDLAAALTFWATLAVAPALLALVALLGLVGDGEQIITEVLDAIAQVAPEADLGIAEAALLLIADQPSAGSALLVGVLLALWSASGYVNAFSRAMNRVHRVEESRPMLSRRLRMLAVTVVLLLLVAAVCLAMVLSGPVAATLGALVGLSDEALVVWDVLRWPLVVAVVAVVVAILYRATPDVDQRLRWVTVGSVTALAIWGVATFGFAVYVTHFAAYDVKYGALASVVVVLLWLWLTNLALVVGAELDAVVDGRRRARRQVVRSAVAEARLTPSAPPPEPG